MYVCSAAIWKKSTNRDAARMANWPLLGMFIHVGAGGGVLIADWFEVASVGVRGSDRCLDNKLGLCSKAVLVDICLKCFRDFGNDPFSAAAIFQSSS